MTDEVTAAVEPVAKPVIEMTREIELRAPFEGWKATMQIRRVPARVLIDLQSGQFARQLETVKKLVKSHNFIDEMDGTKLKDLSDAPIEAITMLVELWGEAVASVPNA